MRSFVRIEFLEVQFYVETIDNSQMLLLGEQLVDAVLKDYSTGEVEHVHHKKA